MRSAPVTRSSAAHPKHLPVVAGGIIACADGTIHLDADSHRYHRYYLVGDIADDIDALL